MRTVVLIVSLLFLGCQPAEKTEEKKTEQAEVPVEKTQNELPAFVDMNYPGTGKTKKIGIEPSGELGLKINFENSLGSEELNINVEDLITRISPLSSKNNYHQSLSVYLFEKQKHRIELRDFESSIGTYRYEIINPSHSPYWQIMGYDEKDNIIVSLAFLVPEKIYSKLFENLNHQKFDNYKSFMYNSPGNNKIEYNSIRQMGKFYEGLLTVMNPFGFSKNNSLLQNYFFRNNKVENLNFYFEKDFQLPSQEKNGSYDTTNLINQSLNEFYYIKGFSYKTTYPSAYPKDSCIEIQIDFKTQKHIETVRMVMGGILLEKIPFLTNENLYNGFYIPLGFNFYPSHLKTSLETYLLMGNSSGLWIDNTYGRNIDGVMLYFDKNMKSKLHIWLMNGDGELPVAHYITTLNQLSK